MGDINFKDFTETSYASRSLTIVYCFIIIAFLDRVMLILLGAGLTMKENLPPWLMPRSIWYGGRHFSLLVMFCLEVPASLIAARCNAMHWVARIMFSWGLVCILMTTMTTELEFYVYRFLLGLCEASLYPVIYSLLIPNWFLPKASAKAISLMLTSLLFSNIIGGPLHSFIGYNVLWSTWGVHSLSLKFLPAVIFGVHFRILDERAS